MQTEVRMAALRLYGTRQYGTVPFHAYQLTNCLHMDGFPAVTSWSNQLAIYVSGLEMQSGVDQDGFDSGKESFQKVGKT